MPLVAFITLFSFYGAIKLLLVDAITNRISYTCEPVVSFIPLFSFYDVVKFYSFIYIFVAK